LPSEFPHLCILSVGKVFSPLFCSSNLVFLFLFS
jgi:hypothetical protein